MRQPAQPSTLERQRLNGLGSRGWRPFRRSQQPVSGDAYTAALRLLARRELTVAQTRDRLDRKGFDRSQVDAALNRLVEEGALNDTRAALTIAQRNVARRRGPPRVVRELEALGIDRDLARRTVHEVFADLDEQDLIAAALKRRVDGVITSEAIFRRLHAYLTRQGFSSAGAFRALKTRTRRLPDDVEQ